MRAITRLAAAYASHGWASNTVVVTASVTPVARIAARATRASQVVSTTPGHPGQGDPAVRDRTVEDHEHAGQGGGQGGDCNGHHHGWMEVRGVQHRDEARPSSGSTTGVLPLGVIALANSTRTVGTTTNSTPHDRVSAPVAPTRDESRTQLVADRAAGSGTAAAAGADPGGGDHDGVRRGAGAGS